MKDEKAIEILSNLLKKYSLEKNEKEAVNTAIGILSWSKITENIIRNKKKKMEKDMRWK